MKKYSLLFFFMLATTSENFAGGGWPQKKREGYFKFSQNWIIADSFYSPNGEITPIRTNSIYTTSFYGEFGITNRLTTILYLPVFVRSSLAEVRYIQTGNTEAAEHLNSIGDTDLGVKYGLVVDKPVVVSATMMLGLPIGNNAGGRSRILQTGDGEFNQMIRLDASHSFHPLPIYTSIYAAFNNRTKGFSDEIRFGVEAGFVSKKIVAIGKLNVVQSLFNGSDLVANNGVFSNNTEYISPAFELGYNIKETLGISISGGFAMGAKNILAAPNWGVGVYWKLLAK